MNEDIRNLLELQTIDLEIKRLETEAKEIQTGLEKKKKELAELVSLIDAHKEKIKNYEIKIHDIETELTSLNERLKKYQEQRNFIKKPRELFAIDKEMETTLKAIRANEAELKKINTEYVNFKTNSEQDESKMVIKNEEIEQMETALKERITNNAKSIDEMKKQRNIVSEKIGQENMDTYNFITEKQGIALSEVSNEACGQCYIALPPQLINEIKRGDRIIRCTSCARILYIK